MLSITILFWFLFNRRFLVSLKMMLTSLNLNVFFSHRELISRIMQSFVIRIIWNNYINLLMLIASIVVVLSKGKFIWILAFLQSKRARRVKVPVVLCKNQICRGVWATKIETLYLTVKIVSLLHFNEVAYSLIVKNPFGYTGYDFFRIVVWRILPSLASMVDQSYCCRFFLDPPLKMHYL